MGCAVRPRRAGPPLIGPAGFSPGPGDDDLRPDGKAGAEESWAEPRLWSAAEAGVASGALPRLRPAGWLPFESARTREARERLEMSLMGIMMVSIESSE